jgi:hypothetical protein
VLEFDSLVAHEVVEAFDKQLWLDVLTKEDELKKDWLIDLIDLFVVARQAGTPG